MGPVQTITGPPGGAISGCHTQTDGARLRSRELDPRGAVESAAEPPELADYPDIHDGVCSRRHEQCVCQGRGSRLTDHGRATSPRSRLTGRGRRSSGASCRSGRDRAAAAGRRSPARDPQWGGTCTRACGIISPPGDDGAWSADLQARTRYRVIKVADQARWAGIVGQPGGDEIGGHAPGATSKRGPRRRRCGTHPSSPPWALAYVRGGRVAGRGALSVPARRGARHPLACSRAAGSGK